MNKQYPEKMHLSREPLMKQDESSSHAQDDSCIRRLPISTSKTDFIKIKVSSESIYFFSVFSGSRLNSSVSSSILLDLKSFWQKDSPKRK